MKRVLSMLLSVSVFAVPLVATTAVAQERVTLFRSMEDPDTPPDPTVCDRAPFTANALLGASLWSVRTGARDGEVNDDSARRIGRATACVELTNFLFPAGLDQNFYAEFDLREGRVVASGTCKLVSNDLPEAGIVLAGCSLKVISGPRGTVGGVVTSSSVFNPFKVEGFSTGSYWTVLLYEDASCGGGHHPHEGRGGHWGLKPFDDHRSNAQVQAARKAAGL
jgi:hypothetical protein